MAKIAVPLNTNARGINHQVIAWMQRELPSSNVEVMSSSNYDDAQRVYDRIVAGKFDFTVPGGGDGSVFGLYNALVERLGADKPLPTFILHKLGTGNGIHEVVGAKKKLTDLKRTVERTDLEYLATLDVPLIEVRLGNSNPTYTFCGGEGIHANVIHEYERSKNVINGFPGYLRALAKTLWKKRRESSPDIEIISNDEAAIMVELPTDSWPSLKIKKDGLIYRGSAADVMVGATPWFGYKLTAFPLLNKPAAAGYLQLRIFKHETMKELIMDLGPNMPGFWDGTFRSKYIEEVLVKSITITMGADTQLHGDAIESFHQQSTMAYSKNKMRTLLSSKL